MGKYKENGKKIFDRLKLDSDRPLFDRLRIRKTERDSKSPMPFDERLKKTRQILNISIVLTALILFAVLFVKIEDVYTAEGVVRPGQYQYIYASKDLEQRQKPLVNEGDNVKKGQPLMKFTLPELEYKILEYREMLETYQAELDLQKAKTTSLEKMPLPKELWEIKEQLNKSESDSAYYEAQYERMKKLEASGDVSQQEVEKAKLEYEQVNIELERLRQRVEIIDTGYTEDLINQAKAEENQIVKKIDNTKPYLNKLEEELKYLSVLKAPADGVILDMPHKDVIGIIQAGKELVYMSIGDAYIVEIFGLQKNFDKVRVGQSVTYKSKMYNPLKFGYARGRVFKISSIREYGQRDMQASDDRYYSILATIDKQPKELKLDSNVTAKITLRKARLIKVLFGVD